MSVTAKLDLNLTCADITSASITNGGGSLQVPGSIRKVIEFAAGSGIGAVEVSFLTTRSLATTNENLDLTALPDLRTGTNKAFAKVKLFCLLQNSETTGDNVTIQPGASNGFAAAFADDVILGPGGVCLLINKDGWTVDSTHKVINVATDHSGSYTLLVLGN